MNDILFKIISSLNSERIKNKLELRGYTFSIAPMNNYNNILRDKRTLDYNIKIFNATDEELDKICDFIINKVFADDFIKKMIINKVLMLSYNVYDVCNSSAESFDCKVLLDKYLGRAVYSYSIEESKLKLIVDVPSNIDVSKWKPVLLNKQDKIFLDFKNNNINLKSLEVVFSFEKEELDEVANTLLDLGFSISKQ